MRIKSRKILVTRFSALGDVAMCVPVIWSLASEYPEHEIVFVSRPFARELIAPVKGVTFVPVDFNGNHKGLSGIYRLFKMLRQLGPFDLVADLHGVTRSYLLGALFKVTGTKVKVIDKGRSEKRSLCAKSDKKFTQLDSGFERYREVFERGGYGFPLLSFPGKDLYDPPRGVNTPVELDSPGIKIGIAPFAKHEWKVWPLTRTRELIKNLTAKKYTVFLFGGKGQEQAKLDELSEGHPGVFNLAGTLSMAQELKAMAKLDLVISMDSANMHLASLARTPVVSIWGATHPFAGFLGWEQNPRDIVQVELPCRPCSVYGNKPCHRADFACMNLITVDMVLARIEDAINRVNGVAGET